MKKFIAASILAFATVAASAQVTSITSVEGSVTAGSASNLTTLSTGLSAEVGNGFAVQATVFGDLTRGVGTVNTNSRGWLLGTSKQFNPMYGVVPTVSVGYGRSLYDLGGAASFYRVGVSGSTKISETTDFVVGYRFQNGENATDSLRQNRFEAGVDYTVTPKTTFGVRVLHTQAESNVISNGVQAVIKYSF